MPVTPLREMLRALPVFAECSEVEFDPETMPSSPLRALEHELRAAVAAGEPEPHAMTLSTVTAAAVPSSRVLLCKDVDETALYFATSSLSRKGRELASNDRAAASFYWRGSGRQFRVVGKVVAQDGAVSASDFADRSRNSQLAARVHREVPPGTVAEVHALAAVTDTATPHDAPAPPDWVVFALIPEEAELWQARRDRLHHRVVWTRATDGWQRGLLWP